MLRKDKQFLAAAAFGLGLIAPGDALAEISAAPDAETRLSLFNQMIDAGVVAVTQVETAEAIAAEPPPFDKDFERAFSKDFEKAPFDKAFDKTPFDKSFERDFEKLVPPG